MEQFPTAEVAARYPVGGGPRALARLPPGPASQLGAPGGRLPHHAHSQGPFCQLPRAKGTRMRYAISGGRRCKRSGSRRRLAGGSRRPRGGAHRALGRVSPPLAVLPLAPAVVPPARRRGGVPPPGLAGPRGPPQCGVLPAAVALPPIARPADQRALVAPNAGELPVVSRRSTLPPETRRTGRGGLPSPHTGVVRCPLQRAPPSGPSMAIEGPLSFLRRDQTTAPSDHRAINWVPLGSPSPRARARTSPSPSPARLQMAPTDRRRRRSSQSEARKETPK